MADSVKGLNLEGGKPVIGEEMDTLDRNRHVFTKGRLEFMGGPVVYEQGHGIPGFENQNRVCKYPPQGIYADPIGKQLGVDITEQ